MNSTSLWQLEKKENNMIYPEQQPHPFKKFIKIFIFVILGILLFVFLSYQTYHFLKRSQIEKIFNVEKNFSILVLGNDKEGETIFISLVNIYPRNYKVGVISFFPQTRLTKDSEILSQQMQTKDINTLRQELSSIMGLEIPFYIQVPLHSIEKFVDLVEGIPYYIWQEDISPQENFPVGEFILDGSLVESLLNMKEESEFWQAKRLYRHYGFLLNFWKERNDKWNILKNKTIFKLVTDKVESNLQTGDLYFLSEVLMSEKAWLPLFMEVSTIKQGSNFIMDIETTALFVKEFEKKLTEPEESFTEESPRMEIRNGTDIAGLAKKMRNRVAQRGIRVLEFSNADRNDYQQTILVDRSANVRFTQNFSLLSGAKYYFSIDRSIFTDIAVIIGKDYHDLNLQF